MSCALCNIIADNKQKFIDVFSALKENEYWYIEDPFDGGYCTYGGYSYQDSIRFKRVKRKDRNPEPTYNKLAAVYTTMTVLSKQCTREGRKRTAEETTATRVLGQLAKRLKQKAQAMEEKQVEGLEIAIVHQSKPDDVEPRRFRDQYETAGPFFVTISDDDQVESKHSLHLDHNENNFLKQIRI